jgi:hypothetical protein
LGPGDGTPKIAAQAPGDLQAKIQDVKDRKSPQKAREGASFSDDLVAGGRYVQSHRSISVDFPGRKATLAFEFAIAV